MRAKEFARHIFEQVKSNWCIPVTEHQVYSTAEQKVGVWTDGKPLYRKTINTTLPDSINNAENSKNISFESLGLSNIDMIYTAHQFYDTGVYVQETPIWINSNNWNTRGVYIDKGNRRITVTNATTANNGATIYIVLHYTKTTDTATSPKVPYEPLHEWSTEEKLVGYWIDGKPVYEKTVNFGALPNNVLKSVPHGITNIDKTISMAGFAMQKKGSNKYSIPIPFTSGYGGTGVEAMLQVNDVNIRIKTNGDLSSYDESYVTLRYTKTT